MGLLTSLLGSDTSFKPRTQPILTPEGEKLEKSLFKSIKTDLFPENLASRFIGDAKKLAGFQKRQFKTATAGSGFTGPDNVVTGNVGRNILRESARRLDTSTVGPKAVGEAKRIHSINRLGSLQNFINLQSSTPILRAQAALIKGEQKQAAGAQEGALLGSIAQIGTMGATGGFG